MMQFGIVMVLFCALILATSKAEDATDASVDVLDPLDSDETFDPQRDYADIKSSYEKLYRMSGPPFMLPPSMQQKPWQPYQSPIEDVDIEGDTADTNAEESTNLSDIGQDTSDTPATTIQPQIEPQTTNKLFTESGAMRSINDIVKSTQRSISLASYEQMAPNAELLMRKPYLTPETIDGNQNEDDLVNETSIAGKQSVVFIPNDANIHNESTDYVMDEANNSQPITSIPNSMDTTITSQSSSPVSFISTRPPNKFEAQPRVYKYNAHEIVRKYFEDIFIRAPLAVLINTAPEPLRKSKLLWTAVLKPNTSIDIVLVAFNSSGKRILL